MRTLLPRERRLLAIAVLALVIAAAWLGAIQPLLGGFANRAAERDALIAHYAANERMIARIPDLRRAAEEQARGGGDYQLAAPDAGQGAEILRTRLEDSLARAGGQLRASAAVDAENGWVAAHASARLTHAQLIDWLGRLQNEPPYLALSSLKISAERALVDNHDDLLDVDLEASIPLAAPHAR